MRLIALALAALLGLTSCSMFTRQGRYERYVRKSSLGLHRRQAKIHFRTDTMPRSARLEPSDWRAEASVSSPESVTAAGQPASP